MGEKKIPFLYSLKYRKLLKNYHKKILFLFNHSKIFCLNCFHFIKGILKFYNCKERLTDGLEKLYSY
jgi:hypothetical protein